MFLKNFLLALMIVISCNVSAQTQQDDFDILCEGTRIDTTPAGQTIRNMPFSDSYTVSPSRASVGHNFIGHLFWYPANINSTSIEFHRKLTGEHMSGYTQTRIDRRSQVFERFDNIQEGASDVLFQHFTGKCTKLSTPKF